MRDSIKGNPQEHKQTPETLVGLFSDKIAAGIKEALSMPPWTKFKDILPGSDPYELMEIYHEQAKKVYEAQGRGRWQVTKEEFVDAVHDWMEKEIKRHDLQAVTTGRGALLINSWTVKAVTGREAREEQEQVRKAYGEKVKEEGILTLTRWSQQKNKQLYPAAGKLDVWSPDKSEQLEEFLDSYEQRYMLSRPKELQTYRLRAVGAFLLQNNLRLQNDQDFVELAKQVKAYWSVDRQLYKFGLKKIVSRRRSWREQVGPQYTDLGPDELTEEEEQLNNKYKKRTRGRSYCLHKYYYVRHIMRHGAQRKLQWQELTDRIDHDLPEESISQSEQLTFHDQYIHFPPPPTSKKSGKEVGFIEAVDYLFKIEHYLTAREKEILLQLFFRYNYYFQYIKPLPKKYHTQKWKDYLKAKRREHKEKAIKEQMKSEPDLFTSQLYLKEELIEAITHRIGW